MSDFRPYATSPTTALIDLTIDPSVAASMLDVHAHAAVAQATAQAVQNATTSLQNMQSMLNSAYGVVLAQMVKSGVPEVMATYEPVLSLLQAQIGKAAAQYEMVGTAAAKVLTNFPPE